MLREKFDMGLQGKGVILSGGSRSGGISRCTVEQFAAEGASITFMDNDLEGADVARKLRDEGAKCRFIQGDLRIFEDAKQLIAEAVSSFGPPSIVINIVGASRGGGTPLETTAEDLVDCMHMNISTALHLTNAALPYLLERPGDKSVIFISSINGQSGMGFLGEPAYSVAKGGLNSLMQCYAASYGRDSIRFNSICPGSVPNPNSPTWSRRLRAPRVERRLKDMYLLGRWGTPEDIIPTILSLASPNNSWLTGQVIYVEGGVMACGAQKWRDDGQWWLPVEADEDNDVVTESQILAAAD